MIKRIILFLSAVVASVGVHHLFRLRLPANHRQPKPTTGYDEAIDRFNRLRSDDGDRVNPVCRSHLFEHGGQTEHVTVFLHGYTNCPLQFMELGRSLHAAGHTVLIPRFPYHGLEPTAEELRRLSVEDLIDLADEAVDIAAGLGTQITVCGLSLGGSLSLWIAQNRAEVARVVALSPALSVRLAPPALRRALSNLLGIAPNFFLWWDPSLRRPLPGREHQYPRLASRGVATILRLGQIVYRQAALAGPAAHTVLVVNNPADPVVDQGFTSTIIESWRSHQADVRTHDLPLELGLPHDYIDPTQPDQQADNAYPLILAILAEDDFKRPPQ